ncbi:MAG: chromophore lyase, partial [Paludibacteraceae bacterium]|nr:chromophore lyase [Paludibacteraceae bacterium]
MTLSLACEAQNYCLTAPIGYGRSATGGTGKAITLVTNQTGLQNAIKNGNGIYIITTNITVSTHLSGSGSNYTLLGLPGVRLINNTQNSSNSGILYLKGSNIIIRNLIFEGPGAYDCDGWDNLCFDGVKNAWVDHCDFQDGCDGNFDNKGKTDNISVTWCRFRYLKSPKAGGSGGTDDHRFT